IWGGTAFFLNSPGSTFHEISLLAYIVGAASIGSITYVSYRPTFYAQVFPILLPFVIKFAIGSEPQYPLVAICTAFYLLVLLWFNRHLYSAFVEALYLRFELKEQKEVAEKAKQSQTQFFAAASHDLRQPLHAYGLLASSLRRLVNNEEGLQILDTMSSSMTGMRNLLNSLLDISRLDAGAMVPEPTRFDIQPMLDQLYLEHENSARERGIILALRSRSVSVLTDRSFLERIIRNLLTNSIHYTDRGTVLLAARFRKDGVRIEVRDSGQGIPEQYHDTIFNEYERAAESSNDYRTGMGLGLAIVQRLSTLLGLKMGFKSRLGHGSVFYVDIPSVDGKVEKTGTDLPGLPPDLRGTCIAIIDDNEMVLFALSYLLQGWGATIFKYSSGTEALDDMQSTLEKVDLLLVDYRLSGENGVEVTKRIQAKVGRDVPALIMTGDTAVSKIHDFSRLKLKVLFKPVEPQTLQKEISKALKKPK
ncbi:MAG: hybrid sensor histidine kinase/response regulator, partial [Gammaproteobacteria bacterium]|nr:hybrid sensor histidine kinase/response regulator [Gammaproteobacteria bacterium]